MIPASRKCLGCDRKIHPSDNDRIKRCPYCRESHRRAQAKERRALRPASSDDYIPVIMRNSCGISGSYFAEGHISLEQYDKVTRDALERVLR